MIVSDAKLRVLAEAVLRAVDSRPGLSDELNMEALETAELIVRTIEPKPPLGVVERAHRKGRR